MNGKMQVAMFLMVILLTSCVNLDKLFRNDYKRTLDIPASIKSIDFNDIREHVSTGQKLKLPVFSVPNQFIEYYPELDSAHKRIVREMIYKNFGSSTLKSFRVRIELLEGVKEFSTTFWSENETVKIRLRIVLFSDTETLMTEGGGEYFVSSADAKYARFEEMYRRTLQAVTYRGLQDIKAKYSADLQRMK